MSNLRCQKLAVDCCHRQLHSYRVMQVRCASKTTKRWPTSRKATTTTNSSAGSVKGSTIRVSGRHIAPWKPAAATNPDTSAVAASPLANTIDAQSSSSSSSSSPLPSMTGAEAAAAAEAAQTRETILRAARLRRQEARDQERLEEEAKVAKKKNYDKRYKTKARKWVSGIIAMPILLVTSWYLYDRLVRGTPQKVVPWKKEDGD